MPFNHRFPCLAEEADYLVGELQHDFPNGSPNAMTHSPKLQCHSATGQQ